MKHAIKLSSLILASIFAVVACEKEQAPQNEYKPGETVTITATLPSVPATDPATKVDFTQGTNKVDLAWSTGDALTIIGEDTSESQTFTLSGISGSKANFTGTAVSGSSFTVLYPGTVTSVAAMDAKSFTGQTQTGNESLAHLTGAWTAKVTGLSDFSDVKFAAPAGGTFAQSGILKFHIQVPDVVTTVKGVGIEAPSAVFYTDNASTKATSLDMTLSGITLDAKHAFTAYMALSQKNSDAVAASEVITVKFVDSYDNTWEKEITLTQEFVLQAGKVNVITLDKSAWSSTGRYAGGTGVDGDPWLITEPIHMQHIAADLVSGETKYFKMMADVDMSGETWTPLNNASPFDKAVNFDGNGKKISNLGMPLFYTYNGDVANLTIEGVEIDQTKGNYGILGRQASVADGTATNVTVKNSSIKSGNSVVGALFGTISKNIVITGCIAENVTLQATQQVGGLVGLMQAGSIDNCSASGSATVTTYYAGGLVGLINGSVEGVITISNSHSSVVVSHTTGNNSRVGGLIGQIEHNATIEKCYATGNVSGTGHYGGGLIGVINATEGTVNISKSYATGNVSMNTGGNFAHAGGLLGRVDAGTVNISNCYSTGSVTIRRYSGGFVGTNNGTLSITNSYTTSDISGIALSTACGLVLGSNSGTVTCTGFVAWNSCDRLFCYPAGAVSTTGNYYGTEGSVSSQAKALGWSETIWDLSGSTPTLK